MSSIFGEDFPIPKKNTWVEITILTYFNKIHNSQTLNLNMQGIEFIDLLSLDSQNVYILDVSPPHWGCNHGKWVGWALKTSSLTCDIILVVTGILLDTLQSSGQCFDSKLRNWFINTPVFKTNAVEVLQSYLFLLCFRGGFLQRFRDFNRPCPLESRETQSSRHVFVLLRPAWVQQWCLRPCCHTLSQTDRDQEENSKGGKIFMNATVIIFIFIYIYNSII